MELKEYRLFEAGESPEFGPYEAGDRRMLRPEIGRVLVARGQAEEVKQTKAAVMADKEA